MIREAIGMSEIAQHDFDRKRQREPREVAAHDQEVIATIIRKKARLGWKGGRGLIHMPVSLYYGLLPISW